MSWTIPFTDYELQFKSMREEIITAMSAVLEQGDLILRQPVADFEDKFARFIGAKHVIGVSNCSDALRLALIAGGVRPGDEVITVAHTFVATVSAIVQVGATPVLIDIDEDHNMDVAAIKAALTPKTKAVIPVHLNGRMCDVERIVEIASQHNLVVIEDAAQAVGSKFAGKSAGSFGLAGCFSFFPGKILGALGDAGAVATDDEQVAGEIRLLRDHGRVSRDEVSLWGFNCRLDALQAAVLSVKLEHVPEWIRHRRNLASHYHEGLSELAELKLPPPPSAGSEYFDVFQSYVIESSEQTALAAYLREKGIEALTYWSTPMHQQPKLGLEHFSLPRTEATSKRALSLPLYAHLSFEQADYVIRSIHDFYSMGQSKGAAAR